MSVFKRAAYTAVDLLTLRRGLVRVINGHRIRFPAQWSRYYPEQYESHKFQFPETYCPPGGTVIDPGAHMGVFTVTAAQLVGPTGRVFAFEPSSSARQVLTEVVRINGVGDRVEIRSEAVGEESGTAQLHKNVSPVAVSHSLVQYGTLRDVGLAEDVAVLSIDGFVRDRGIRVDFLKLDVEGAELAALRGATETLRTSPVISLSVHPEPITAAGDTLVDLWAAMPTGTMTVLEDGEPISRDDFCGRTDRFDVQLVPR